MAAAKVSRFSPSQATVNAFPKGFVATGIHCGVKKSPSSLDLALILSSSPRTAAAGCFTRNVFKAAPVQASLETLRSSRGWARGVVVNSGCANAVTGNQGLQDARTMAGEVDKILRRTAAEQDAGLDRDVSQALVMSTGVIGQLLPIRRITSGIAAASTTLSGSYDAWLRAAQAFMTTDTFPKLRTASFELFGRECRFVGIDKGAGMIHPSMAAPAALHGTLLGLVATDAPVSPEALQTALTHAVDRSFNSISVDGDMSTNDTILALANGAASSSSSSASSHSDLLSESAHPAEYDRFVTALTDFCTDLASLIVRDGEGATKFVKITVSEALSYSSARAVASTIAQSPLVKCALHGEDANWGRILCAVGYAGVKTLGAQDAAIVPERVSVSLVPTNRADGKGELKLLVDGEPQPADEARASEILREEELEISVRLGQGSESASYYTCDLSKEYIAINADYRS